MAAGSILIFKPLDLKNLTQASVLAGNIFNSNSEPYQRVIAGVSLRFSPVMVTEPLIEPVTLHLSIDGDPARIGVERSILQRIVGRAGLDVVLDTYEPHVQAMILEHCLAAVLDEVEARKGIVIKLERIENTYVSSGADPFGLEVLWGVVGPFFLVFNGGKGGHAALFELARMAKRTFRTVRDLRQTLSVRVGSATLRLDEWRDLKLGDAIVVTSVLATPPKIVVCGEKLAQWCQFENQSIIMAGQFEAASRLNIGDYVMNDAASNAGTADDIGRVGNLPVKLVFELARLDVTVAELAHVAQGHVFILPTPVTQGVKILSGGAVVGAGEIVRVGDQFAVRVTAMAAK
jgi:type III secretion protein Q